MAKIWYNHPCIFYTRNTENNYGDSKYTVTLNAMTRFAPVNLLRAPAQVNTGNPSICYLDPKSQLYTRIMRTLDDSKIKIESAVLNIISVNADGLIGAAFRKPETDLVTFDFVNNNGVLSHIHVGHKVYRLG